MTDEKHPAQSDEQDHQSNNKQNNPFSEQEKHGEEAQRPVPGSAPENQDVRQRAPYSPVVVNSPLTP